MSRLTLQDLLQTEGGTLWQSAKTEGTSFTGVSIDSRTIKPGEVFFAINGERFDGHSFLEDVIHKGAAAVVVSHEWEPREDPEWDTISVVRVPDTTRALGEYAAIYRKKFDIPVIAVTGTNGKTTTKEMLYDLLLQRYRALKSQGNFNNRYGLPLTLFRLRQETEIAVVELGASYPGEIEELCSIALPTYGIITNIGKAHLEFFQSVDEVLRTKAALLNVLPDSGTGFVNGDDVRLRPYKTQFDNVQTFGMGAGVDIRATDLKMQQDGGFAFTLNARLKTRLYPPGRKNVYNALAAAALGLNLGMDEHSVLAGIESFTTPPGGKRMEISEWKGAVIINDSYNANPDSMKAALEFLMEYPLWESGGSRCAVLGDMLELGKISKNEHAAIGKAAASLGVDRLITVGSQARFISDSAQDAGVAAANHADDHGAAAELLRRELKPGDIVLVKGSRGSAMEKVLEHLK